MTIYLPSTNYACYVTRDNGNTIRAYESTPRANSTIAYTDYYINSHYLFNNGEQQFTQYATLPTCMGSTFTTNVFYRNDFDSILVIFFILVLICFYFPFRIFSRFFGRWLKW